MLPRATASATGVALTLAAAVVTLTPSTAHATPESLSTVTAADRPRAAGPSSSIRLTLDRQSVVTGQTTTARATVEAPGDARSGKVQFAVDGTKVGAPARLTPDGRTHSPALRAGIGVHRVSASYIPAGPSVQGSTSSTSLTVAPAATTTKVVVSATGITATVNPVAPGAGTPTGTITFFVDGTRVGSGTVNRTTATLVHAVATDRTHVVSAAYGGDPSFTASSASTSRSNPRLTVRVVSARTARHDWYRTPVKVVFECTSQARLVTPCPKPVTITRQGSTGLTRTIHTTDGGIATVATGVRIDTGAPRVAVTRVRKGATYFDAPRAGCSAGDALSGLDTCTVKTTRRGSRVVVTARAMDLAGNSRVHRTSYRRAHFIIDGARKRNGVYQIRHSRTYAILVHGTRPRYVHAAAVPGRPRLRSAPFDAVGENRWAIGFALLKGRTRDWNLGFVQNGKLHVIRIHLV